MSDEEIARLHRRIDGLEKLFRDHDKKNAARFDEMRKSILGDSINADQPGILRRIQTLENYKTRMIRNAQFTWGFLLALTGSVVSWFLSKIGAGP